MKFASYLLISLFSGSICFAESVQSLLQRSIYNSEQPPQMNVDGVSFIYDPMMLAVLASLKSRDPQRTNRFWKQVTLAASKQDLICPRAMTAYYRRSSTKSPLTFVILPGSYATWTHGSFLNQTVAVLNKRFNYPNIISMSGYLTPDFLAESCAKIPWDSITLAKDIRNRIGDLLKLIHLSGESTGIIGFSGGGYLALSMLGTDSMQARLGEARVFGLGGMTFSPIIDGLTAFHVLDAGHRASRIDPELTLTGTDWANIKSIIMNLGLPTWKDIPVLFEKNPSEFIDRAYNDFTSDSLRSLLTAIGKDPKLFKNELSYYNVFVKTGFKNDTGTSDHELDFAFQQQTDLTPLVLGVDRPTFIYFSKDDPVLSDHLSLHQPPVLNKFFWDVQANPLVTVFNPNFGGHTGALLDPIFADLIESLFFKEAKKFSR